MIKTLLKTIVSLFLFSTISFTAQSGEISKVIDRYLDNGSFKSAERNIFTEVQASNQDLKSSVTSYRLLKPISSQLQNILKEKPQFLKLTLPDPNTKGFVTVLLFAKDFYTSDFKISVSDHSKAPHLSVMNYRGIIENKANSFAAISIYENEVMGLICDETGNINLGKLKNDVGNTHIIYNESALTSPNPFMCSVSDDFKKAKSNQRFSGNQNQTSSTNCVNFYWEIDQDLFTDKGSIGSVTSYINGIFNQVSALYDNDGITANLQTLYIWNTVDPYTGPASGDYLDQFGTNRTSFSGDLGHLIGYGGGGGVAWVDVLCNSTSFRMGYSGISSTYNNVPTYSWTVEVISHEQGHNMASEHTHDCVWNGNNTAIDGCGPNSGYPSSPGGCAQASIPAKGTIMSYCHLSGGNGINLALGFGPQPTALILNRIDNAGCLAPCAPAGGAVNDDPCSATPLTVGLTCSQVASNNIGAVNSSVPDVSCDGIGESDVWFSAVVPPSGGLYINSFADGLTDMGMAVYTGSSCSSLTFYDCYSGGNATTSTMPYAQIASGLTPGSTVWIRMWDVGNDENGTFNICVTDPCQISASISGPATICSGTGTQICATAGFSNYSWSTTATSQCITPASSGTYTVTVTDAGGCTATATKTVTVNTAPAMSITGSASGCANSFPQLCAVTGFSSYSWSNSGTTQCIAPASTGTYTVTGTDGNGCTASSSQAITILPNPTVSITGPTTICPGTSAQLCAVTSGGTYSWSNGGTLSCITVVDSAIYTVTVTGGNGCTSSASQALAKYAVIPAVITGPTNACFGSVSQLCAPAGFTTYAWSTGASTQCINATTSGTYTVQLTDANGCTASASHTLTVGSSLNLSITGPAGVCSGQSAQLCATATGTISWSTGATTQCITPATSGTYSVTVTDAFGCTGSASKTFTIYPAFSAAVTGPSTACYNSNPQLCAPAGTGYRYSWSSGDTTRCITANTSGIYTVTITNSNGCTATGSKGLTVYSQLNATISGPSSLCLGAVGQLCAPTGSALYQWSTGSISRCINVNSSGTYTVTITDVNGCTASNSLAVTFSSSITTVITGSHTPCPGQPLELCVPSGYNDYTWNTGETTECISVTSNGNYSVTIHDAVGCVGNDTHVVVFNSLPPVLIAGQNELCQGEVGIICATAGYSNYNWNTGSNQSCISVDTAGTYGVTITDSLGCTNSSTIQVNVTDINPTITYTAPDLNATPTGLQYTYAWTYNGSPFGGTTSSVTPDHTGFYTVIITDMISGCIDSTTYYQFMVGTEDMDNFQQIRIYPNPVSNELLNIAFDFAGTDKISVQLTDALGQILKQENFTKTGILTKQIRVSDLAAGIYLVNIKGDSWRKSWKIIKQ